MGQVVRSVKFSHEPVRQHPGFTARRADVCQELQISASTIARWERTGIIWAFDDDHPDGQYIKLPSGRPRYSLERLRAQHID